MHTTNTTVSVVLPTRNEEASIGDIIERIWDAGIPCAYEIVVVDDSNDRTAEIAKKHYANVFDGQRKGLGQAIVDGIEASNGAIVLVMDSDGQHRPEDIVKLLEPILYQGCDMTIGSRYVKGGEYVGWSRIRRFGSRVACLLALPVTGVKDATSGFFAFRKSILEG